MRRRACRSWRVIALAMALLLSARAAPGFTTVVIDPGHGGHDRGGIPGQRIAEKTMALDMAFRLRARLRAAGLRTVMTRTDDTFISLPERVRIANEEPDAVFVSVHFNAAPRVDGEGFETYYYSRWSARLAQAVYGRIVQAWPGMRRGVFVRGYYVIRKTAIPSILIEPGFLTNPRDASLISQPGMRQRLANLVAAGIISQRGRRLEGGPGPAGGLTFARIYVRGRTSRHRGRHHHWQ